MKTNVLNNSEIKNRVKDDYKQGDQVRHHQSQEVATISAVRKVNDKAFGGLRKLYTLDFGHSVKGAFGIELNGGEFLAEALEPSGINDNPLQSYKRTIVARAQENKLAWRYCQGYEIRVRPAYKNDSKDPRQWSYCVCWYRFDDDKLLECENGVSLEQAAKALMDFPKWASLYKVSGITDDSEPKAKPMAWNTDYTAEDFHKLTSRYEIADEDRDVMGCRFVMTNPMGDLEVFVSDYAGNERHALIYLYDEFMQEVRANVQTLDWIRAHFNTAKGWQRVAA